MWFSAFLGVHLYSVGSGENSQVITWSGDSLCGTAYELRISTEPSDDIEPRSVPITRSCWSLRRMKESHILNRTVGCNLATTPVGPDGMCSTVFPIAIAPHSECCLITQMVYLLTKCTRFFSKLISDAFVRKKNLNSKESFANTKKILVASSNETQ